jgi:hypothetical protein
MRTAPPGRSNSGPSALIEKSWAMLVPQVARLASMMSSRAGLLVRLNVPSPNGLKAVAGLLLARAAVRAALLSTFFRSWKPRLMLWST